MSPERQTESADNQATCPHCGTAILALVTSGPSTHALDPCGCRVTTTTVRDVAGGVERGRGVRADGGTSTSGTYLGLLKHRSARRCWEDTISHEN